MKSSMEQLRRWMSQEEDEHLEFKQAKSEYQFDTLAKYCSAIANEGGGRIILGVSDRRPRRVVGSAAFKNLQRTKSGLNERFSFRVDAEEIQHPDGRVLVFEVPARPPGIAVAYKGACWMRDGESLKPMTAEMLKSIFSEVQPDFSQEICSGATFKDLDARAVERFRQMWQGGSGNSRVDERYCEQMLADAELIVDGRITFAALILLGTRAALGRHLPDAELVFEYRSSNAAIRPAERKEFREGFLLFADDLWQAVNKRNDAQPFQDGLFVWEIPTFNEAVIREAIHNAISHRDYRAHSSVFVRQFPAKMEIVSPGGFPPGVTAENIIWKQSWRNRRLAEAMAKCRLVERGGQGADMMFRESIREGKPTPDYSGTDDYQVKLTLRGEVRDPRFLRFLEEVGKSRLTSFTTEDFLVLDYVRRGQAVPAELKLRVERLAEEGVIESVGRGRAARHILSHRFYRFLGKNGVYTRKRGLDRETNKELLLTHLRRNRRDGSQLAQLRQVLPMLSRGEVQGLLKQLKSGGRAYCIGRTRAARWYPVAGGPDCLPESNNSANKTQ